MPANPVSIRLFALLQGIFLLVIAAVFLIHWLRKRDQSRPTELKPGNIDLRTAVYRTPVPHSSGEKAHDNEPAPKLQIGSAFPVWDKTTPPHEILGIHAMSDANAIEAAYKAQLKKYHPDRVAHWGKGYQTRAHHVVLLLQDARDRMLGKKS